MNHTTAIPRAVGVIGLGAMGAGMAQSLRRAGHHVHVHDIRPETAAAFAAEGGTACATLADMAAACRIIVSVVVNARQTEAVLFGEGGIAPALQPGSVFVMCSTVDPNWSVALEARLQAQAREAISGKVVPAFQQLRTFFVNEYVPQARTTLAAEAMPDGKAYYKQQIHEYTTLDLSPDEIHRIGLDEVARIQKEMNDIIKQVKFKGSFAEFLTFLRTDPQFYARTPEELLSRAAWISKRADGQLGKYMTLPRARFTIVPVPPDIAPFWTAGRGGMGTYWLNTYNLPSRPLYNLPALTLHESSPGHSLQGALAEEQGAQPDFRRKNYISAYGEGWALYTEKLGKEMGIYETPYEDFGRLTYEMWRAARLVIDTGLHHKRWSREKAIQYLTDSTPNPEGDISKAIERYVVYPGQATAYMIGKLKIMELRTRAQKALGTKFEYGRFHDAVLKSGPVPLTVLEERIDAWIAQGG